MTASPTAKSPPTKTEDGLFRYVELPTTNDKADYRRAHHAATYPAKLLLA